MSDVRQPNRILRTIRVWAVLYGIAAAFIFVFTSPVIFWSVLLIGKAGGIFQVMPRVFSSALRWCFFIGGAVLSCVGLWHLRRWAVYWTVGYNIVSLSLLLPRLTRLSLHLSPKTLLLLFWVLVLIVVTIGLMIPSVRRAIEKESRAEVGVEL